jgi:hypothetical protein
MKLEVAEVASRALQIGEVVEFWGMAGRQIVSLRRSVG